MFTSRRPDHASDFRLTAALVIASLALGYLVALLPHQAWSSIALVASLAMLALMTVINVIVLAGATKSYRKRQVPVFARDYLIAEVGTFSPPAFLGAVCAVHFIAVISMMIFQTLSEQMSVLGKIFCFAALGYTIVLSAAVVMVTLADKREAIDRLAEAKARLASSGA